MGSNILHSKHSNLHHQTDFTRATVSSLCKRQPLKHTDISRAAHISLATTGLSAKLEGSRVSKYYVLICLINKWRLCLGAETTQVLKWRPFFSHSCLCCVMCNSPSFISSHCIQMKNIFKILSHGTLIIQILFFCGICLLRIPAVIVSICIG